MILTACVVSGGCATGPDAHWLGPHSFGTLIDGHRGCGCCQHQGGGGCQRCDESAWPADGSDEWHEDWYASEGGEGFAPLPLDGDQAGGCSLTCDDCSCQHPRRRWYESEAGIFNFCVPPGVIGPLPPPPPGRFHPVPTRPVFAPRPTLAFAVPIDQ